MIFLKKVFLFIVLFVAISVNLCWSPKVMALRELPFDIATMKVKLPLLGNGLTCYRFCNDDSDCADGTICRRCAYNYFTPNDCSILF
ncbi:hypothetical protein P3S68_003237 [Capsicum galapagoense]